MTKLIRLSIIILFSIVLSSCGKKLIYFQEKDNSKNKYANIEVAKPDNPKDHVIEAGDILGLKINTSNPALTEEFSKYQTNSLGVLVQENGTIFLPYTGSIKIAGISIIDAQSLIISELEKSIVSPKIELTLNSFRITVLGEVRAPGIKNSPGDRMTILDALSLSGDLGTDAKRTNIKLIRQSGDKKIVHFMDLTSVDVFKSDTYYLKSNDIIYVESLPKKSFKENLSFISIGVALINTVIILTRLK